MSCIMDSHRNRHAAPIGLINVSPYVYNQADPMVCMSDAHPTYNAHRQKIAANRRRKTSELS